MFPGAMGRLWVRQSLSAVTGACLLLSKDAARRIGPLDEERFAIAYNDVDFCLRARSAGLRVVWTPFAALMHRESASRGSDETPENINRFRREQDNLKARHATDRYEDFAISPWYSKDRSSPEWMHLQRLPRPRAGGIKAAYEL
jgi:GT2 family glycosyltransferase